MLFILNTMSVEIFFSFQGYICFKFPEFWANSSRSLKEVKIFFKDNEIEKYLETKVILFFYRKHHCVFIEVFMIMRVYRTF